MILVLVLFSPFAALPSDSAMSCYVMTLYTGRGSSAGERTTPGQEVVGLIPALGTAVPSLHFSSARGPARGAVITRSHNPGSDVTAAVSVTQKNTFSWVRKKNHKKSESDVYVFLRSSEYYLGFPLYIEVSLMKI